MDIEAYKFIYPEIWDEVHHDKIRFIRALYDYDIINLDQWGELFNAVTMRRVTITPEDIEVSTVRERLGAALWRKISDFFSMMWADWAANVLFYTDKFYEKLANAWTSTTQNFIKWHNARMLTLVTVKPEDPPLIHEMIKVHEENPSLTGAFWIMLYRLGYVVGFAISLLPIISKDAVRSLNKEYSPMLPDISTLVTYYYKTPGDRELVYTKAAEQGFEKSEVDVYIRSMEALFSVDDLRNMFLRGIVDDETLHTQLRRAGWDDASIDKLKQIFYLIPGPSEQIRFAVREAFDEEYIKRFDTMKDFPEGFAEQAQKVGIDRYWAEKFWAAHWELPPLAAAYEMLHRDVIESSDLDELFKAQDVMPWWREKLKAISFNPLTRVDVRRMYKVGTLDREGVHRAYLDVGYNEKNAALMTDFTIKWVSDDERDLSKADILGAYQRRLFSKSAATKSLTDMGYDKSEAALLMSRIDYELAKKKKSSVLKNLEKGYKKGIYDSSKVQGRMQELNMSGAEITELVNLWDAETTDDTRSLSKADLDALFKKRVIDEKIYRVEMTKLKYIKRDVDWMVKLHG